MKSDSVKYTLCIWITTVLLSPVLYFTISTILKATKVSEHLMLAAVFVGAGLIGALYALPAWLILTFLVDLSKRINTAAWLKRLACALLAAVFTYLTLYFMMFSNEVEENKSLKVRILTAYCCTVMAAALFYTLPERSAKERQSITRG